MSERHAEKGGTGGRIRNSGTKQAARGLYGSQIGSNTLRAFM